MKGRLNMITVTEMWNKVNEKIKSKKQKYDFFINKIYKEIEDNLECNLFEIDNKEENIKICVKVDIPEINDIRRLNEEEQLIIFSEIRNNYLQI